MDERLLDYHNYDKLTLFVKDDREENLIRIYKGLGYDLVSSVPNKRYNNIIDLTFVRSHKIKNKDKLQYLQVGLEIELNNIGRLEKNRHAKSMSVGLTIGAIAIMMIALGVYFILGAGLTSSKIGNLVMIVLGLLILGSELIILPKIIKKENENFEVKNKETNVKLEKIFEQIKIARGGDYGD